MQRWVLKFLVVVFDCSARIGFDFKVEGQVVLGLGLVLTLSSNSTHSFSLCLNLHIGFINE